MSTPVRRKGGSVKTADSGNGSSPGPRGRRAASTKESDEKAKMAATIAQGADATAPGESFARKLLIRTVFGLILGGAFLALMVLPHHFVALTMLAGQIFAWKELVALRFNIQKEAQMGGPWFRTFNWYLLFLSLVYFYGSDTLNFLAKNAPASLTPTFVFLHEHLLAVNFVLYLVAFIGFIVTLQKDTLRYQLTQLTWTILTLLLIMGQSHFGMYHIYDGLIWLYAPHGLIVINDIMAYFFGIKWGRKIFGDRPLTPLSPNKTWEGFIGGLFSTVILGFILAPLFASYHWLTCPAGTWDPLTRTCPDLHPIFKYQEYHLPDSIAYLGALVGQNWTTVSYLPFQFHVIILALFASVIAPFGGFLASGIKRAYNKKDFDNTIPGHGGFMDRADCQFLMAFFNHVYFTTFIKPSTDLNAIFAQIAALSIADQQKLVEMIQRSLKKI